MTHPELDAAAERADKVLPAAIAERVADHLLDEGCRRSNDLRELRMIADEVIALPLLDDDRITHLNKDLDTLLWLHAEASWLLAGASKAYFEDRRKMDVRLDKLKAERNKESAHVIAACQVIEEATADGLQRVPGVDQLMADLQAALLGGEPVKMHPQPRPDAVLPTTREQLAKFFGGIRLASGAVVTGHFVQHALDLLDARRGLTPPTRESLAAFFAALPKCATEALAAEQIDDATARRVINRMIYGNPAPEDEVPGA